MPQVVEAKIPKASFLKGIEPSLVADVGFDWLAPVGEAKPWMLPCLFFQNGDGITVKRDASRRAILGLIEPGRSSTKIDPFPLQA